MPTGVDDTPTMNKFYPSNFIFFYFLYINNLSLTLSNMRKIKKDDNIHK